MEGRAYLLRPDTPKEGAPRAPRPGESEDELSEPLRSQAEEAGLIMKPPPLTPNSLCTPWKQPSTLSSKGNFWNSTKPLTRLCGKISKTLETCTVIGAVAESVGLNSTELLERLKSQEYSHDGDGPVRGGAGIRDQGNSNLLSR